MPSLDYARASDLLRRVVNRHYTERHIPISGAFVKSQMLAEVQADGSKFSERELGYRKFVEFVRSVEGIAIQGRAGSDILLAPVTAGELLASYATPLPRLRRDFWRAFIEFPVQGVVRLYDPDEDKIIHVEAGTQRPGIEVDAIAQEVQIQWRRTFSQEQPETIRSSLLSILDAPGSGVFVAFARRLRENPSVARAWNHYLQRQITDQVALWAAKNRVPEERWLASSHSIQFFRADADVITARPQNISQRAELYNFLDQLPIEDLLQLRVPLEWVLKVTRRGDA
jgi:hypothetical protein